MLILRKGMALFLTGALRRYSKWFLLVLLVILIVEVMILAPGTVNQNREDVSEELQDQAIASQVEQSMEGVHLVETSEGEKEWELWADEALAFKAEQQWTLENVKAVFFGKDGVRFTVTGKEGYVEPKTKNMQVKGDVVTRSSNGYVFKTQKVTYSSSDRSLSGPHDIDMVGPKDKSGKHMSLTGTGMKADLNESTIKILSNVLARKDFQKGQKAKIRSRTATFSGRDNRAQFQGNVVIDYDTMRLTGPDAEFDYDNEKGIVKSMYVKNGVRVSDAVKFATSDNVRVLFEEEMFVFKGAPRVVQNNDEIRGEEIVFLNRGETVKVMKVRARVEELDENKGAQ